MASRRLIACTREDRQVNYVGTGKMSSGMERVRVCGRVCVCARTHC